MRQNADTGEMQIDLLDIAYVFFKRWWLILTVAIIGTILGIGYTKMVVTPTYSSSSLIYVLPNTTSVTSVADLQFGTVITNDFTIIATSKPVIDKAIEIIEDEHNVKFARDDIRAMISITNLEDTRILDIQATSANAEYACWVANAMAEATAERMQEITKKDPPTTVEKAEVADEPNNIDYSRNAVIGFVVGAALVCGVLLVLYLSNDSIRTEEDVEKYLGEVTLVSIPYIKEKESANDKSPKSGVKRENKE